MIDEFEEFPEEIDEVPIHFEVENGEIYLVDSTLSGAGEIFIPNDKALDLAIELFRMHKEATKQKGKELKVGDRVHIHHEFAGTALDSDATIEGFGEVSGIAHLRLDNGQFAAFQPRLLTEVKGDA